MLSFKQYLQEDIDQSLGTVNFIIHASFDRDIGKAICQKIFRNLKKKLPNYTISFDDAGGELVFGFKNLNEQIGSETALENIVSEVEQVFEKYSFGNIEYIDSVLHCNGFPPYKLEWRDININFEKPTSISGIEKVIGPSTTCVFYGTKNIFGGVLSLLKIKEAHLINLYSGAPKPQWIPIVEKHLNGDRNIAACQTELLKNGLKEYAKL